MKNITHSILAITIATFLLIFTSCNDKDPIIPGPGPEPSEHPQLWSYDIGFGTLNDITPAIDNNDNIYFSMANMETSMVVAIALDKDGNELWKQEFEGSSTTKLIYGSNKVFVSTAYPTAIHCLNSSSGSIEWSKNLSEEYEVFDFPNLAFANNKLYVGSKEYFSGFLFAYDLSGNELWSKQGEGVGQGYNLSVSGNSLYFHNSETLFRYDDKGTSCDSIWAFELTEKANRSLTVLYDLPIGDDGNIYIRSDYNISIISPAGELVESITLDDNFYEGSFSNITLTSDNDIIIGNGNLVKFSNSGNMEWETSLSGLIVSPFFGSAATIADNGNLYDGQTFGLFCINSNGSTNWQVTAENGGGTEHGNLHPPVLNHSGDIISVAAEANQVRCFKGDGHGLATSGWPKPYADYGNTSSK